MAEKKKKKHQIHNPLPAPTLAADKPFLNPRRSIILCVATLCLLWLIQFFNVLTGGGNLWEDIIFQGYPFHYFARAAFLNFEFPHWNPYSFSGMPFHATGAGVLYPFNFILTLLPVSDAAFWWLTQFVIVLHVLIGGLCMFVYLRYKKMTNAAALFGATAFMLSGFMITRVIHPSLLYIAAWLPLQLLLLERGIREAKPKYAVIGGLLLGAVMQVGHAQVMLYAVVFLFLYAAYFFILSRKDLLAKRAIAVVVFFGVAAGLSLVQYLPIFEASGHTMRIQYTLYDASEGSLQFIQLITALMPKIFGAYTGSDGVPPFWLEDSFRHGYYNYWESSFYFGVSTLILSLFLFSKIKFRKQKSIFDFIADNHRLLFVSLLIIVSFMVALGGNFFFYKLLFSLGIPGFNSFRCTPRILFIWGFLFPMMAAAVLDSLNDLKSSSKLKSISLLLCGGAALLGIITAAGGLETFFQSLTSKQVSQQVMQGRMGYASQQGLILFINALLFGIVLILFFKNKITVKTTKIFIIICIAIDMLTFAAGQHITRSDGGHVVFGRAESMAGQIRNMREEELFRINTRQYVVNSGEPVVEQRMMFMDRNQGYVSGIETTEGYNQFRLRYASLPLRGENFNVMLDLMNVRYYVDPAFKAGEERSPFLLNATRLPRAKLFYKAKVIEDNDSLILEYMNSALYDHHNEIVVTDQFFAEHTHSGGAGTAQITKYGINRIELNVESDREAILWLSEIWFPAWKATINGEETKIHRANHSFRAVVVPAGKSKVIFKYDSRFFNIGAWISSLTLIAALLFLILGRKALREDRLCSE
ncbi:MAG: YfhO family protein [Chitinispirillales bacterium]|jgi:hypothetical protein|nr:YfhO family protein [Chitinispirillales bacterium]